MDTGHHSVNWTLWLLLLSVNSLGLLIIQVSIYKHIVLHLLLFIVAASVIPTNAFGVVQNFSLINNIVCNGTEDNVSDCVVQTSECIPLCPKNIGIKCFSTFNQLN